ncbi:NUDIX hydrolase [Aestuariivirga sp.]|uniref:NUDIX hydrolase n=1 Tax=Aestuariivirga sp. TaxID=2650926 RepID=UPI0039E3DF53
MPLRGLDLRMGGGRWAFADAERGKILGHWQARVAANPALWNGEVLICTEAEVEDGILRARFAVTDFASFVAWRDWDWPDRAVRNCFGVPAAITSCGALLFGVMGSATANAGKAYPPSGSLEPRDVLPDGRVDIYGSMCTELLEETGIDLRAAEEGRLFAVFEGQRLAVIRIFRFAEDYATLARRVQAHLETDSSPELESIEALRSVSQIDLRMPGYAQVIAREILSSRIES